MNDETLVLLRRWSVLYFFVLIFFAAQPLRADGETAAASYQCGADAARHLLWQKKPHLEHFNSRIDDLLFNSLTTSGTKRPGTLNGGEVYTIPVVVHIVHNGGSENISDAQVLEGIRHINEALGTLRLDNSPTISIALCMARQDDNTMPTNGITRTQSPLTDMTIETDDIALKDLSRWSPAKYLNIWIVRSISSSSSGSAVAGYAYMPFAHNTAEDGIVIESRYFGSSAENSAATIHELGHYLGLYHTFQGGCGNDNCLLDGDRVCDTPPDASTARSACNAPVNSCTTDSDDNSANNPFRALSEGGLGDQNDMTTNIMDYGDLACLQVFTPGQAQRMRATLLEVRSSLLASPGCQDPCTALVSASFSANRTTIVAGESVQFLNTSKDMSSYTWRVNGTEFATTENATYTFTTPGVYSISLEASNGDVRCTRFAYDTITVHCGVRAAMTASDVFIQSGQLVSFASTSTGAHSIVWIVDGQPKSTSPNYSQIFTDEGGHLVLLVASNEFCSDTAYAFVNVGSCGGNQSIVWYFGDRSGLNFSTDPPTVLSDGRISTREGCATISSGNGELLFYTDGVSVWNRHHNIMPGGNETLGGHSSSSQSALILPHPGDNTLYYIFTTDAAENLHTNGLSYAVVDMSRDNGFGTVTEVRLGIKKDVGEKLTAIARNGESGFWIVVRGFDNRFYSYSLTAGGISDNPVASTVSKVYQSANGAGTMKISPDGKWIALANFQDNVIELYPFSKSTGTVLQSGSYELQNIRKPYGLEFSPDNRFLYCSQSFAPNGVYQYDLRAGNPAAVQASAFFLDTREDYVMGALQTAPDGKIYIARYNAPGLDAINAPNQAGAACDYRSNVLALPHLSTFSLPSFINLPSEPQQGKIAGPDIVCLSTTASYTLTGIRSATMPLRWKHYGKAEISFSDDNRTAYLHFSTPGIDTLVALYEGRCSIVDDTLVIRSSAAPVVSLGPDTSGCGAWPLILDPGPFTSYRWQDGSTARTFAATSPGTYWVTVTAPTGCTASDTVVVGPATDATPDLGPDISTCTGVHILDAGPGFRRYRWPDGSNDRRFTVYTPGTYWVEAETFCGSLLYDTVVVSLHPLTLQTSNDTTICLGNPVQIAATGTATSFLWSPADGLDDPTSRTPTASPDTTTTYTVRGTNAEGCAVEGSITVTVDYIPLDVRGDTTICRGMSTRLSVAGTAGPVIWTPAAGLDDPTSLTPMASPDTTTTYTVRSFQNGNCVKIGKATVVVERIELQVSNDTTICQGGSVRLAVSDITTSVQWTPQDDLDDPFSPTPTASPRKTTTYTVRSTLENGCFAEAAITVVVQSLSLQASNDTTICPGDSARLSVQGTPASVLWTPSDGLDDPTSPTPMASPDRTTTYTVHSTTPEGCTAEAAVTVSILDNQITLRLPDTTAVPGTEIGIPLYLDMPAHFPTLHLPVLRLAVRYRASLLKVHSTTTITAIESDGDYEILSMELRDIALTGRHSILATITGRAFLGDSVATPLLIESVSSDGCIAPTIVAGSLTPAEVCNLSARLIRLRDLSPTALAVAPNPASDAATANITTSEEGTHTLSVYNLQGQLLWREHFVHSGARAIHTIPIELHTIPAGLYKAVLTTPSQAVTTALSVVK